MEWITIARVLMVARAFNRANAFRTVASKQTERGRGQGSNDMHKLGM